MASFFTVPANWSFDKSDRYEKKHPGSAVQFGLRKAARQRQQGMGAYLYRYPGDWSMDRIEDESEKMKGGALDYELGQSWNPQDYTKNLPPNFHFYFRFLDPKTNAPLANQTVHVRIEDSNAGPIGGWTSNVTTDANGIAKAIMGGYGDKRKYVSITPKGSAQAIVWRFPVYMSTGGAVPIDVFNKPGGDLDYSIVLGPNEAGARYRDPFVTILGVGVLIVGVAFLGYQLYKGSKKASPALQPG